jgi:hypothetical protein
LISALPPASAYEPTAFHWQVTNENPPKGYCLEVDRKTGGDVFQKRVPQDNCRPKEDQVTTLWLQKSDGPGGQCYQVDKQSLGLGYARSVGQKDCEPEQTESHLIEGKCYIKGERLDGSIFLVSAPKKRCKPEEVNLKFLPASDGLSGRCVSFDSRSGEKFNEPLKKCKPEKTDFLTIEIEGEAKCFEVSKEEGAAGYIKKVNNEFCRPQETQLMWVQTKEKSGECYLTSKINSSYREKVTPSQCYDLYKTETQFIVASPIRGECFLIDSETKGSKLRQFVGSDKCEPKGLQTKLISYQDRPYCIQIDLKDLGSGFRKTVPLKKCYEGLGDFTWVLSDSDPLKGVCYEKVALADEYQYHLTKKEKCRPEETIYKWQVESKEKVLLGKCYEIAKDKGNQDFVMMVARKFCKPKTPLVVRYFHPEEYERGGCYMVDKETLGGLYSVRTDVKKCKMELFGPPP